MKQEIIKGYSGLLLLLSLTVMLVMAGESMLTAALVEIEHEFSVPGIYESWVLPVVLLVGAVAAPFVGSAGDRYGHRRLLLLCLGIYLLGLVMGILAPDIWTLLISRGLQGAGIAAFPLAYAIIRNRMPEPAADVGIGVISAMYGAGTFIGVITGSFITESFSWRMTYLVLIPVAILLIILVSVFIRENKSLKTGGSLDWAGFSSFLLFLFLALVLFSLPAEEKISLFAAGIGLSCILTFAVFLYAEKTAVHPLADLRLLQKRPVTILMIMGFLTILAFMMLLQMMPYVIRLPTGLSLSAEIVGLIIVPGTLCDMMAGPLTGRMIPRIGCRIPCITGSLMLAGAGVMLFVSPLSVEGLTVAWMLFSFGMSVIATATLIGVMDHIREDRTAEATGIIQSMQTLGGMTGPVVTGLLLETSQVSMEHLGETWTVPTTNTYYLVFLTVIVISIFLLLISWFFMDKKKHSVNI